MLSGQYSRLKLRSPRFITFSHNLKRIRYKKRSVFKIYLLEFWFLKLIFFCHYSCLSVPNKSQILRMAEHPFLNLLMELTDDEEFVEVIDVLQNVRRQPQTYRRRQDHFLIWNEEDFRKRFRLSKQGVHFVIDQISDEIISPTEQ